MNLGIQKIIDRISDIFTIFDFSYLVSGITTLLMICYGLWHCDMLQWPDNFLIKGTFFVIMSYLCGLISFAIGKFLRPYYVILEGRGNINVRFMEKFRTVVAYGKDSDHPLKECTTEGECKLYYTEMWSFLRQCEGAASTLSFINRYWVMQAVYEGLAASFLIGAAIGVLLLCEACSFVFISIIIIGIICSLFCCHEATRYAESQISEIVIAYKNFKFQ